MKKSLLLALLSFSILIMSAQDKEPVYKFENLIDLTHTETKNQCQTGTCWSFATISFLESELIRMGKGSHNLSSMFV